LGPRRTYLTHACKRQFLEEAADLDRLAFLAARLNHRMESILDPRQHLRVALQDRHNFGICLLDDADGYGEQLRPSCQTGSMVWRPEESDAARRLEDVLEVTFRSLSRRE
jgi:hypothetical protein